MHNHGQAILYEVKRRRLFGLPYEPLPISQIDMHELVVNGGTIRGYLAMRHILTLVEIKCSQLLVAKEKIWLI